MAWKKKLWGVEFTGSMPDDKPELLGTGWMSPRPKSQYDGEPTRAILFMTREQAREWCRKKRATYAGRGDCCEQWKFTPVRVLETVVVMPTQKSAAPARRPLDCRVMPLVETEKRNDGLQEHV